MFGWSARAAISCFGHIDWWQVVLTVDVGHVGDEEPFGLTLTATYDAVGNRTLLQDSLGGVTTSVYDAANRLTSRQFGGTGQTPLRIDPAYTARDQLASLTRYSDLAGTQRVGSSAYTYDGVSRLTNLQHQNSTGGLLANYTYTYDLASHVFSEPEAYCAIRIIVG